MVDITLEIDIKKLKALPLRLRVVAGVIAFDLAFLLLGYMVLDDVMAERVIAVEQARTQLADARRQNADIRKQLDDYPALRQRYEDSIAKGLTSSLDRLKLIQYAQSQAAARHLGDLHFRMADEAGDRDRSTKYRVETDRVAFESGGLLDTDAVAFWDSIFNQTEGHYRLVEASLERTQDVNSQVLTAVRHGNPVSLLKAKIEFQWIGVPPLDQETK